MPEYTVAQMLAAIKTDHPEFANVDDKTLLHAVSTDHPDLVKGAKEFQTPTASTAPPESFMHKVGAFGAAFAENANPISALDSLIQHPIDTIKGTLNATGEQFNKAKDAYNQGHYSEAIGHGLAYALPVIGPAAANAAEEIGSGQTAAGLGHAGGLLAVAGQGTLRKGAGMAADVIDRTTSSDNLHALANKAKAIREAPTSNTVRAVGAGVGAGLGYEVSPTATGAGVGATAGAAIAGNAVKAGAGGAETVLRKLARIRSGEGIMQPDYSRPEYQNRPPQYTPDTPVEAPAAQTAPAPASPPGVPQFVQDELAAQREAAVYNNPANQNRPPTYTDPGTPPASDSGVYTGVSNKLNMPRPQAQVPEPDFSGQSNMNRPPTYTEPGQPLAPGTGPSPDTNVAKLQMDYDRVAKLNAIRNESVAPSGTGLDAPVPGVLPEIALAREAMLADGAPRTPKNMERAAQNAKFLLEAVPELKGVQPGNVFNRRLYNALNNTGHELAQAEKSVPPTTGVDATEAVAKLDAAVTDAAAFETPTAKAAANKLRDFLSKGNVTLGDLLKEKRAFYGAVSIESPLGKDAYHVMQELVAKANPELGKLSQKWFTIKTGTELAKVSPFSGEKLVIEAQKLRANQKARNVK